MILRITLISSGSHPLLENQIWQAVLVFPELRKNDLWASHCAGV